MHNSFAYLRKERIVLLPWEGSINGHGRVGNLPSGWNERHCFLVHGVSGIASTKGVKGGGKLGRVMHEIGSGGAQTLANMCRRLDSWSRHKQV